MCVPGPSPKTRWIFGFVNYLFNFYPQKELRNYDVRGKHEGQKQKWWDIGPPGRKITFYKRWFVSLIKRINRKPGSCMFSCMWISSGRLGLLISETYLSFSLFFLERQLSLIYWLMSLEPTETLCTSGPYISLLEKQEFPEIGLLSFWLYMCLFSCSLAVYFWEWQVKFSNLNLHKDPVRRLFINAYSYKLTSYTQRLEWDSRVFWHRWFWRRQSKDHAPWSLTTKRYA